MSKHPGGRPPMYDDPQTLMNKAIEYLDKQTKLELSPTITGLCLHLGFESRDAFYKYEKKDKFRYTIKKLRTIIENAYEQRLFMNNPTGAIFALKNFGWTDKQEIEHSGNINFGDAAKKLKDIIDE